MTRLFALVMAAALVAISFPAGAGSATIENSLLFVREDGSRLETPAAVKVACGRDVVRVVAGRRGPRTHWTLDVALPVRRRVIRLPNSATYPRRPAALLFAVDARTEDEYSSAEDDAQGRIILERVRCRPRPEITFRVEGRLGSEVSDATAVVTGRVHAYGWPSR